MGKITKTMQPKHMETLSPWLKEYVDTTSNLPLPLLRQKLQSYPHRWASPRGDLYHWIPLLNRFDDILQATIATYDLHKHIQTRDFGCDILLGNIDRSKKVTVDYHGEPAKSMEELTALGYGKEGDKQLLIAVLEFTQMLLTACGNRSIYMSSSHLEDLLNSTYNDVVTASLQVGQELAQRYQASVKRLGPSPNQALRQALLANHYDIDLEKVQILAQPFIKTPLVKFSDGGAPPATPASAAKGKDKAQLGGPKNVAPMYANDLKFIVAPNQDAAQRSWNGWGDIKIMYQPKHDVQANPNTTEPTDNTPSRTGAGPSTSAPATPTPLRRSTTMPLGQTPRQASRQHNGAADDSSPAQPRTPANVSHEESSNMSHKVLTVPQSVVVSSSIYELLARCPPDMPLKAQFEYLTRLRVAKGLVGSLEDRQTVLSVRLLAVSNLAYIYGEKDFLEKVLKHDDDEPRRTQLVYQLADLIHPAGVGETEVPLPLQSIAFNLLEMISHYNARHNDVLSALNANVNHGVLLYVVRKAVEKMSKDDEPEQDRATQQDKDEWLTSLYALAFHLGGVSRLGPEILSAGLMDSLIEILKLRTQVALRYHSLALTFLDNLVAINAQGGYAPSFSSPNSLETAAELLVFTVSKSEELVAAGQGMPPAMRTVVVDYDIPFYQQQTLKWGLKFIHRVMTHFSFGAQTDRVLRNMVDNSALLRALRSIIENKQMFGAVVWTNAVTLLSDFLNNDPTSFAAIQESGMIKGFLEALTGRTVTVDTPVARAPRPRAEGEGGQEAEAGDAAAQEAASAPSPVGSPDLDKDERPHPPTHEMLETPREVPLAKGILPSAEAICIVPAILNSICLNNAGMKMVVQSRAIDTLMEVFESPQHVRLMETDWDCFHNLGAAIDELARHHPSLRKHIGNAIIDMLGRVVHLAYHKADVAGWGAKLLLKDPQGNILAERLVPSSAATAPSKGKEKATDDADVEMVDATEVGTAPVDNGTSPSQSPDGAILNHVSAVPVFLEAVHTNTNLKRHIVKAGGIELLLKLMEAPSLPSDLGGGAQTMNNMTGVVSSFIELEPSVGLPSLLRRLQKILDILEPLADSNKTRPLFSPFLQSDMSSLFDEAGKVSPDAGGDKINVSAGTPIVRALVHAQFYLRTLAKCFPYSRSVTYSFPNVNVYDYFTRLVKCLGPLIHGVLKEDMAITSSVPAHWLDAKARQTSYGSHNYLNELRQLELHNTLRLLEHDANANSTPEVAMADAGGDVQAAAGNGAGASTGAEDEKVEGTAPKHPSKPKSKPTAEEQNSPQYLNYRTLATSLSGFTESTYPLYQMFGKALFSRERKDRDAYTRYHHMLIAESMADTLILKGVDEAPDPDFQYWILALHVMDKILLDSSARQPESQRVPLVLPVVTAFKEKGGIDMLNTMLQRFADVMMQDRAEGDDGSKAKLAAMGMKKILEIYTALVNGRNITEANSLVNVTPPRPSGSVPDRTLLGQISSQIVVELRTAILPVVRKLWDSKLVEKCSTPVLVKIIDILKMICAAEQENTAYRKSDNSKRPAYYKQDFVAFKWTHIATDISRVAFDNDDLAKEALYRTNGKTEDAMTYAEYHRKGLAGERHPIPEEDAYKGPTPRGTGASSAASQPAPPADPMNVDASTLNLLIGGVLGGAAAAAAEQAEDDHDDQDDQDDHEDDSASEHSDNSLDTLEQAENNGQSTEDAAAAGSSSTPARATDGKPKVCLEDLDELRSTLRDDLIDRCLDVLQAHPDSVFEISELIQAAILRSESAEKNAEVGEVLANALMSFASEDDKAAVGQSIAAYAHLLSLLLQNPSFYKTTLPALKENTGAYLGFLVPPTPTSSTGADSDKAVSAPWMAYILLIFETLLTDDESPVEFKWKVPNKDDEIMEEPVLTEREPNLTAEEKSELVQNVLTLLPHIGKDEALATAVLRILAIVTRDREIAKEVGSRKQLQRLFVMAKQLCGAGNGRLRESRVTKSMLIILRHIIEDEDTIRQIMRTEIKIFMENASKNPRTPDLGSYLRHLAHVALRNPQIFIETTADMVKFSRWTYPSLDATRPQPAPLLVLKESAQPSPVVPANDVSVEPAVQGTEDLTINDVKPSTEAVSADKEMTDVSKTPAVTETKPPVLENPDGVVHFILCELLNYREVEDKEVIVAPTTTAKDADTKQSGDASSSATPVAAAATGSSSVSDTPSTPTDVPAEKDKKTSSSPKFKTEEHPIFVYRCFLLHCLTELLQSYTRAKVEFINFKRNAPIQAATPVKPRSSVLNYLLHDLVCYKHKLTATADTIAGKKAKATAAAAENVLVALMAKTGEKLIDRRANVLEYDDETDLLFVRKFVLDTILKAYKNTVASSDPFEARYAKMLSLADLMNQMIGGGEKDLSSHRGTDVVTVYSQTQIKRIMYEKGYLPALTGSISEIDLSFPEVKQTIKNILRVLKALTKTAIQLSHANLITDTQADTFEDDVASIASSLSDLDDDREETPDLYRNSTLGMLDPGNEDDYSEDEEDEDDEMMYDDGYDDEMDYGEEMSEDQEEDVSDEDDEELQGMGPIEGLPGDIMEDFNMAEMMEDDDEDMDEGDEDMDEDDDEEDDEDEDEDDDDEESGSEDLEELEDQVEIMDEEGNPVEDDGQSGWEDDTDDDEHADEGEGENEGEIDYDAAIAPGFDEAGDENGLRRFANAMRGMGELDDIPYPFDDGEEDDEDEQDEDEDDMYDVHTRTLGDYRRQMDQAEADHEARMLDLGGLGWDTMVMDGAGHHHRHRHGGMLHPNFLQPLPLNPPRVGRHDGDVSVGGRRGGALAAANRLLGLFNAPGNPNQAANEDLVLGSSRAARNRPPGQGANHDDGLNPLLRRDATNSQGRVPPVFPLGMPAAGNANLIRLGWLNGRVGENPLALLNDLLPQLTRHTHAGQQFQLQITEQGVNGEVLTRIQVPVDPHNLPHPAHYPHYHARPTTSTAVEPQQAVQFTPVITVERWQEEARMVFGHSYQDRAPARLTSPILYRLVPPAIKHDKEVKAREAEEKRKRDEERKKREEEEKKIREAKEAEEKAAKEKKEAEERERAEREAAAAAAAQAERDANSQTKGSETGAEAVPEPMEGVEATSVDNDTAAAPAAPAAEQAASSSAPRVTTTIRGETIDVTELGIDPDYLAALPEEYREEVIAQTVSSRRLEAQEAARDFSGRDFAGGGGENTEVYQEFLDALPDDLRAEIVQQERHERRRRDREEQRRHATTGAQGAADMDDPASILLTFPPELREEVFISQGEELMDQLSPELAAEARAIAQRHGALTQRQGVRSPARILSRTDRQAVAAGGGAAETKPPRRTVVQMLDKQGVATLLRLIFVAQPEPMRKYLQDIFVSVCENRLNRLEVVSTLLLILQDGSTDVEAVERSFGQLSLKAKPQKDKDPNSKTPSSIKRTLTNVGISPSVQASADVSPLLVVQQCLDLLTVLSFNPHVTSLFLTEHDIFASQLKRGLSRKGKGKEVANTKAQKYAINYLLGLLDRELVMQSSNVMQTLADLLNKVTYPLQAFERRRQMDERLNEQVKQAQAEAREKQEKAKAAATADEGGDKMETEGEGAAPAAAAEQTDAAKTEETATTTAETQAETKPEDTKAKAAEEKKSRQTGPPTIPEANLKLVTNIFVARECSSKTFQNTISTIKNLSYIPGAKKVFGEELVRQARVLSENIVADLDDLLPHILKAESGTQIQGVALAKFSPGASEQNKLLRVLTALDHLFDKKGKKTESGSDEDTEKGDLLGSLYWNPTFGTMWEKLSACLAAIRERENMLNVATILLPLIESLMVVCKNTTINDAPLSASLTGKDMLLSSPPPENRIAGLFFTFTEEHRRILNELVRNNPKLMSGTFSLLVKNPKVLEFDNKRNYFNRSVHHKTANQAQRPSYPTLQLSVRRDHVFHDSFKHLYYKSGDEIKFGKLNIRFHGEEGVDAGGVTREWFQSMSRQMFDANYALFVPVSSDRTTFHPNKLSGINEEHLQFFKFIGRIIGKALYEGRVLDCYFSRAVYKRILGKAVSVKDMESFDPDYYKSLTWMLENDITDIITETFSVEEDAFGVVTVKDLCPDGRNIPVTEENKHDYVRLVVEHKLLSSVSEQMEHFLKGFHDIIPAELIAIFNEQELELLISGLPDIDVDDWKAHTEYHNYNASSPQIQWFWRAVRSFDKEERAKLLQFVTGTSKVPLNGFKELEGMNGVSRFNIHRDYGNKDRLPSSHTCFNQLDLPEYESYDTLRSQIMKAITSGSDYFGFA